MMVIWKTEYDSGNQDLVVKRKVTRGEDFDTRRRF